MTGSLHSAARQQGLVPGVRAAAALLSGLYVVLGLSHFLIAPAAARTALTAAAWTTAALAGGVWGLTRRRTLRPALAPHLAGALATLAAGNSLLHLALTGDPAQVTNVMLVLVACGAVVDDLRWSVGVTALSLGGVAAVAASSPADPLWTHFAFGLASAALLGLVLRLVRQRGLESLERARQAAADTATHDSLTGLLNRRGLDVVADQALRAARRSDSAVGLLFIDLDGLKAVNDALGHGAGDTLISEAGRLLRDAFREADAVARIGGDEFAVLLVGADATAALLLADRARSALQRTPASVGAASAGDARSTSLSRLLELADADMYRDKNARRRSPGYLDAI